VRSRRLSRAERHAKQLPFQIETRIVRLKRDKPSWGAEDQGTAGPPLTEKTPQGLARGGLLAWVRHEEAARFATRPFRDKSGDAASPRRSAIVYAVA
jgi:hypothetical protein